MFRRSEHLPPTDETAQLLKQLGFTETQAMLYLTLLKAGRADARTLAKHASLPRTTVYRALSELRQKGLVEQEVTLPLRFQATPICLGLQILMKQKVEECREFEKKAIEFLRQFQENEEEATREQEYRFILIDGRERQIQKIRQQHDNARYSVDVFSTMKRVLYVHEECIETVEKALDRGVQYRVMIEKKWE